MSRTRPIIRLREVESPAERRTEERFPCDLDISVGALSSRSRYYWTARVWDVSPSGISLLLKQAIAPGTILEIEIVKGEAVARRMLARVAHATEHSGGSWIIGCNLERKLTSAELQALASA